MVTAERYTYASLKIANNTNPPGLGEPLNTILSAESDGRVLDVNIDKGGFLNYMLATSLGEECLGQHYGDYQMANLGDGNGNMTELEVLRWNYGDIYIGTCRETFNGGLHLRYWRQNHTYVHPIACRNFARTPTNDWYSSLVAVHILWRKSLRRSS